MSFIAALLLRACPNLGVESFMNGTLFIGGPHDGRRIKIPEGQRVTEIFNPVGAGGHGTRERYYLIHLTDSLFVAAHEPLSAHDVLETLIRRYPQALKQ